MFVFRNQRGFTFLEMSIVIAIVSILLLIAIPNYHQATARAQEKSCEANRNLIETQVQNYYIDKGTYTAELETLVSEGYVKEEPKCPAGGTYTITPPSTPSAPVTVTCDKHPN